LSLFLLPQITKIVTMCQYTFFIFVSSYIFCILCILCLISHCSDSVLTIKISFFLEIQIGSNSRRIIVEFRYRRDSNNRVKIVDSNLFSFNENLSRNWKWILNLKSFEVIHGMSRVVMLAPGNIFF
jgi:hypothetical protein